jgi:ABC-type transport system involved in cytochrome bd biosynthesis fused ATPase/permease subunit/predicted double-glycine peptidase
VRSQRGRRFFAPEVVQTSAMDCGPATLKSLLEGFGIPVSYGRLREACQTDLDGTSIDTLEEIALKLGLDAEQVMIPPDHLFLPEARALPAIVVVRQPSGLTHFLVAWRCHGPMVQLMDPATGRRWMSHRQFLDDVYRHEFPLSASYWRAWAGSEEFLGSLRHRLNALGISAAVRARLVDVAMADPDWRTIAALDAATRMSEIVARAGGVTARNVSEQLLESLFEQARLNPVGKKQPIPDHYWIVQAGPLTAKGEEQLVVRGAVLVRVLGRRMDHEIPGTAKEAGSPGAELSPELAAALTERPSQPGRELFRQVRADGLLAPAVLVVALALASAGTVLEAILFRGLLDIGRDLNTTVQRMAAIGGLLIFEAMFLSFEFPIVTGLLRLGRRLEVRLRVAFLQKIPRLMDCYLRSRLISDMAERSHRLHTLRLLPELGGLFLRSSFEMLLTTAGLIWLDPPSAPLAIAVTTLSLTLPMLANPFLNERHLRIRTHLAGLSRFYLDALLGLLAVRASGAERALAYEHQQWVGQWARASLAQLRMVVAIEAAQGFAGFGLAAWLLFSHWSRAGDGGGALLMAYWALRLPVLGQEIALVARQYPEQRSLTLRLLEPLGAPERTSSPEPQNEKDRMVEQPRASTGREPFAATIRFQDVTVRAAGHIILAGINLDIPAGTHVAIVGPSGAGKSSLVGLLLGWHRAAQGCVLVDEQVLDEQGVDILRRGLAWVDPTVHVWNRSLIDNLRYGNHDELTLNSVLHQVDLLRLVGTLPDGMQTALGEGGALVSGGEGQRIRAARAMLRSQVRLAILDEPFRGLDRDQRHGLLTRVRELWRNATLICITHDLSETRTFDRVLLLDRGRVQEDGAPASLAHDSASRYHAMLQAEEAVRSSYSSDQIWRRARLETGQLASRNSHEI